MTTPFPTLYIQHMDVIFECIIINLYPTPFLAPVLLLHVLCHIVINKIKEEETAP